MIRPNDRGTPIDGRRYGRWLGRFATYRNVTRGALEQWIEQFQPSDRDLGARILDAVYFLDHEHIRRNMNALLKSLNGWDTAAARRHGRWFFVPFSGSVGESGDSMVHVFRQATGMTSRRYDYLFIHRSQLVSANPGADDTVVLIDDFSGTGNQAKESWEQVFAELLPNGPRTFLLLVAATDVAVRLITEATEMEPVVGVTVPVSTSNIFAAGCRHFSPTEKTTLLTYCAKANPQKPRGWGNCGLLVVPCHRCPNNCIPVLHAENSNWQGIFPRN